MKTKQRLHRVHFGDDNTPLFNGPVTIAPLDLPRTVSMDDKDVAEYSKDPYWLSRMISQEWDTTIPKGADGVAGSAFFSKEGWDFIGIQFYASSQDERYVPQETVEKIFRSIEGLKSGLEKLLEVPIEALNDEIRIFRRQLNRMYDEKIKFETMDSAKPLAFEMENWRVYHEKKRIPLWRLVPVGLPLVVEMLQRSSYDIWTEFDDYLEEHASEFLPAGANAYVSERGLQSPAGIGHLRAVQPYRLLSEQDGAPVVYCEMLQRMSNSLRGKIDALQHFTLKDLYSLVEGFNDENSALLD